MELEDKPAQSERAQNERQTQDHGVAEVGRDLGGGPWSCPLLQESLSNSLLHSYWKRFYQ